MSVGQKNLSIVDVLLVCRLDYLSLVIFDCCCFSSVRFLCLLIVHLFTKPFNDFSFTVCPAIVVVYRSELLIICCLIGFLIENNFFCIDFEKEFWSHSDCFPYFPSLSLRLV